MVGAKWIAETTGIDRSGDFRLIVVPIRQGELDGPYGHEKLAPILSLVSVSDETEGLRVCRRILGSQGRGHTAVIRPRNPELAEQFGRDIEASRILVNTLASQGCIGIGNGLTPSFHARLRHFWRQFHD